MASLPAAMSASSSKTAGFASWMSSTRISCSRSRSAARKSGASWKIWRAAVMMPAGSKASGMRRSRTSRYSEYSAAAGIQSGRLHCRASVTRSSAVRPDSMIRSKSWRTSCRKPRVCSAASRSSGHGSSRPGSACPSSSSLMIRSCSGPESSFGWRGSGRMPSALARRIRSKAYDAQVRAGVVLRLRSRRAVKRSRSVSAASLPGARMSIRSGSRPSRWVRRTAASTRTVDLPVPGAPGTRTGPEPGGTSTAASWSGDSTGTALWWVRGGSRRRPAPVAGPAPGSRDGGRCGLGSRLAGCPDSGCWTCWLGVLTQSFHHPVPTIYATPVRGARRWRLSGRSRRRWAPTGLRPGQRASGPRRSGGSRRNCPAAASPPGGRAPSASCSWPGGASPLDFSTRHQGTLLPWWLMTEPTWRGPPEPRSSATSP